MAYDSAAVSNTVIAHKKGINLQTIRQLRDNLLAVVAGASGAPKVQGQALQVFAGELAISGTTAAGFTDIDRATYLRCDFFLDNTSGVLVNIQVRFSDDNGATYGAWRNLFVVSTATTKSIGWFRLNIQTGAYRTNSTEVTGAASPAVASASGTVTVPTDVNAVQFRADTAGVNGDIEVYILGGQA